MKMGMCNWIIALTLLAVACVQNAQAAVRRVDKHATGTPIDGSTWDRAYRDLQPALVNAPPGTDIWVAAETYTPGTTSDTLFVLRNVVHLYGGFLGTRHPTLPDGETDLGERDFVDNVTILSGDIGVVGADGDNCYCVVVAPGVADARLDGFTITGGNGGYWGNSGAGVYIVEPSHPTIANCLILRNNVSAEGAGMYVEQNCDPTLENCTFQENRGASGAGLTNVAGGAPWLTNCAFIDNVATGHSGGMYNGQDGSPRLVSCMFIGNVALGEGGGGGLGNNTGTGGNAELINCLFSGNMSFGDGGAINNWSNGNLTLTNCSLSANASVCGDGGGVFLGSNADATITNGILWQNTDVDGMNYAAQIESTGATLELVYSCVLGWTSGGTNTGADPLFIDPDGPDGMSGTLDDNVRLVPSSPGVDTGDNDAITESLDLDGNARKVDGDGDETITVDMGAYEYDGEDEDCNGNSEHDLDDIRDGTSEDCNGNLTPDECEVYESDGCPEGTCTANCLADCNQNCVPDGCDIAGGTSSDCQPNGIPDECEFEDCNENCEADDDEITADPDLDTNENGILDECEFAGWRQWTEDDDFDDGTAINVNHDEADELQRNTVADTAPLPYLWAAASGHGTIVRIRTQDEAAPGTGQAGDILGEYRTAPRVHVTEGCSANGVTSDPSRTTVDLDGSIWAANRGDNYYSEIEDKGSVVKIGLVIGGTRVDGQGRADAGGDYLAPPFDYCACEDRDGDGLIRTSRGPGDVLAWDNWDGEDDDGGVENAEDECIIRYVRVVGTGTRTVAIDKNNDVWTGGTGNLWHEKVNGFTGVPVPGTQFEEDCGGYGGFVDCNGVLWSARGGTGLLRYDTTALEFIECLNDTYGGL